MVLSVVVGFGYWLRLRSASGTEGRSMAVLLRRAHLYGIEQYPAHGMDDSVHIAIAELW